MPKLQYTFQRAVPALDSLTPHTIQIELSAPAAQFEKYRRWLDFCMDRYRLNKCHAVYVRYQKRDTYFRGYECFNGWFNPKYGNEGDISVCVGKTASRTEEEIMFTFFHEYGHFLQYDQNRYYNKEGYDIEKDADLFAEKAMREYLESGISNMAFVSPASLSGGTSAAMALHTV